MTQPGEDEELIGGGRFTAAARRSAINAVLPLLVTYFADAPTWNLETTRQLASSEDEVLDSLAAAARLRASLAAAERLLRILGDVTARPTFRYTQTSAESIGTIRGRLDLPRYIREQGRVSVPRRYPIRLVERENATPENVLASYAAHWIRRDLQAAPTGMLPAGSPEKRDLDRLTEGLERSLGLPLLAGTAPRALEVWRRSSLPALLEQVSSRLEAGHVASPEPYRELADWVEEARQGNPTAAVGDREWSFYDSRFDTKLFEIWCLHQLSEALTHILGAPEASSSLADRKNGPLFEWKAGAGMLRLHFQTSLSDLSDESTVWSFETGSSGKLRGFPDIAVTAETVAGHRLAILDPKLRRRPGRVPTEELYKMLGYFGNLKHAGPPLGAIFYYSPEGEPHFKLTSAEDGELHALGVNPESDSGTAFEVAAALALRAAGIGAQTLELIQTSTRMPSDATEDRTAALQQTIAVEAMRTAASRLPAGSLAPTRKATSTTLREIWTEISGQSQMMIITAEYFGLDAPSDADHSGPLLGLAAAFELTLHERIFSPAKVDTSLTLGQQLHFLEEALRRPRSREAELTRQLLDHASVDISTMLSIAREAKKMNRDFRVPAAHASIISQSQWADGRELILDPHNGLLVRFVKASRSAAPVAQSLHPVSP